MQKILVGTLAICGLGSLGMIVSEEPQEVTYADGNSGTAYIGIHLTDRIAPIGSPWSSRSPRIVGHITDFSQSIGDKCSQYEAGQVTCWIAP